MKTALHVITAAILASLICAGCKSTGTKQLIANAGMESPSAAQLPRNWEPLSIGAKADVVTDTAEKHAGTSSIRIDASDFTRTYACSDKFPVVPGEKIDGSAYVKVKDVPPDHGIVIMMAEFFDPTGQDPSVEKFNVANLKKQKGWQKIRGTTTAPANAVSARVRVGFSYAKGTCWWDDVTVKPRQPLAARLDIDEARLSPAMQTLPVLIVNREARQGPARVKLALDKQIIEQEVTLDGNPTQRIELPIKVPSPGKVNVHLQVLPKGQSKPKFATTQPTLQVPHAIVFPPVSPTHWVTEDGPPKIEGRIDLAVSDAMRQGATLRAHVRDSSGKTIATWEGPKEIPDGITEFNLEPKSAPQGTYTLVAELTPKNGKPIAATQPWHVIPRSRAKVTISPDGFPVHDGKPIFPLGIFNGGKWEEQAKAGFTVTHAYNAARITPGPRPQDHEVLRWLDNSEANGMKMLLMVPMRLAIKGDWDGIRRRVRMFRNHPGLLAWDEEEGFARGDFKPDTIRQLRKIISEEDPNHPFMVGDARSLAAARSTDRSNFFPEEMDLGMWWWYPFPLKARAANALEGEESSTGQELDLPTFLTKAITKKPLWVGIQSYKKKDSRYPTPQEYRCQAYLALAAGAKGLMWYGGSVSGGVFLAPEEGNFEALKKVAREINDLSPELLGATLKPPLVMPASAPINVVVKQSPKRTIVIAVNRSNRVVDVTLSSPMFKTKIARVYESQLLDASGGGLIADHFEPFEVHVYEIFQQ
jgi:hypothetical protein